MCVPFEARAFKQYSVEPEAALAVDTGFAKVTSQEVFPVPYMRHSQRWTYSIVANRVVLHSSGAIYGSQPIKKLSYSLSS